MQGKLLNLSANLKKTVNVHSGIRTEAQQKALRAGGNPRAAKSSPHVHNEAADISVTGMTGRDVAKAATDSGEFERVNLYTKSGAVHVDEKNVGPGTQYYEDWKRKQNPK